MQFLIYILVYPIIWCISKLPFRLLYAFSDALYVVIYYVFGYRKKVVKTNLELVFPNKSQKEIKRISKRFFKHLCDMMLESIKSLTISEQELKKRMTFSNIEVLKDYEKQHRSIVLMCAHYGSWEWIFILQRYVSHNGYAVYKRIENKYFDKLIKSIRAKYNTRLITTKETFTELLRAKKENELTINGFVSDQTPRLQSNNHWYPFMGIPVPVHVGAEILAKRLDMAVVFFSVKRLKRGVYQTTFTPITNTPKAHPDFEITEQFMKLVEKQIHEAPEYYLWTHKRWKHKDHFPGVKNEKE